MQGRLGKILVGVLLLGVLVAAIRSCVIALASEETRIRWRLEEMVEGFNERRLSPVMDGFAHDFLDAATSTTREQLREIVVYLFLQEIEQKSGRFLLRAELVPDDLSVTVEEGPTPKASAALHVRFFESRTGTENLLWDARIEGALEKRKEGWQWVRTTRVNHADRHRLSRP